MKTIIAILILLTGSTVVMAHNSVVVIPLLGGSDAKNLKNVVTVAKANGDFTNPVDAVNSITDATVTNPYLIVIGPGIYDLGTNQLVMKQWVSIQGAEQDTTKITGAVTSPSQDDTSAAILVGNNNVTLTNLSIENIGGAEKFSIAIYNSSASPRIENVSVSASGAYANIGVYNNHSSSPIMTHCIASTWGGTYNNAITNLFSSSPIMTDVIATASGGGSTAGNTAIVNHTASNAVMTNVTASGLGGASSVGVRNDDASPIMNNVTASGLGGIISTAGIDNGGRSQSSPKLNNVTAIGSGVGNNAGMSNGPNAKTFVRNSVIEGDTTALYIRNSDMQVVNTKIIGEVSDLYTDTAQCRGVYDENLADVDC